MNSKDDCVFISGFGLANYRSFGAKMQRISPCKKINLLIGQNNSGKSNILSFIQNRYCAVTNDISEIGLAHLEPLEMHRGQSASKLNFGLTFALEESKIIELQASLQNTPSDFRDYITAIVEDGGLNDENGAYWFDWEANPGFKGNHVAPEALNRIVASRTSIAYASLSKAIYGQSSYNDKAEDIREVLRWLTQKLVPLPPKCETIPAIRLVGNAMLGKGEAYNHGGEHLIQRLAELQHPDYNKRHLRNDFERIEALLRDVTDRPTATLEVPDRRNTINVMMDGQVLPLDALGTGIHEVIILAAAATTLHKQIICIEEPEIHLHPLLQKKLLRYLTEQTDNQYFISTHSAHLLDHPGAAIFHVRLSEHGSTVKHALEPSHRFKVCTELGYKASDLLQANCILWVEGPSDRIYLREWISLYDKMLVEGIHYSIMFYGGRLLSNLSASDPEVVNDFISLRHLNRNMILLMDSDREAEADNINETKRRIVGEWEKDPGFAWITAGREIENYVSGNAIVEAQTVISPRNAPFLLPATPFSKSLKVNEKGKAFADKIRVAHWLVEKQKLRLDVLDLKERVQNLCTFIREVNHAGANAFPSEPQT